MAICEVEHDPRAIDYLVEHGRWPATASQVGGRQLTTTRASSLDVKPVHWLWTDRIPAGALTLLAGREGIGKSLLGYSLAADITRGTLAGNRAGMPAPVLVIATEDSWSQTIVPRLMAANANLDLILRVTATTGTGGDTGVNLPVDLAALEQLVKEEGAALVLLDPLMSRLDSGLDSHKDAEVRQALEPLVALAERTGVALLGLIHVNKTATSDPLTSIMASRAFAAVARAVLYVARDVDQPDRRLVETVKSNLGRLDLPTLTFSVVGMVVASTAEGDVTTGQLQWTGETSKTIRDVLSTFAETSDTRTAKAEAADWLTDYFVTQGGSAAYADIRREASKAGHAESAIKRAGELLRVRKVSAGFPRTTTWTLPAQSAHGQSGQSLGRVITELIGRNGDSDIQSGQLVQSVQSAATPREANRLRGDR